MTRRQLEVRPPPGSRSGAALIMCLMLLGALSLLGLSAAAEHQMQLRMSRNVETSQDRRHNADQALIWAEDWLLGQPGASRLEACNSNCSPAEIIRPNGALGPSPQYHELAWWQANGQAAGFAPGSEPSDFDGPWYVIEELHYEPSTDPESLQQETAYYRILARGSNENSFQSSVTESLLARPWGHEFLSDGFPTGLGSDSFCLSELVETPCGRVAWRTLRS